MTAEPLHVVPLGPERREELLALDHLAFVWTVPVFVMICLPLMPTTTARSTRSCGPTRR